ncbi:GntR family transcriptional regulator [Alcaligenaceae bacterium]|nr:GntR family transcriptional regulator [Alcaligenaceae bacterium]
MPAHLIQIAPAPDLVDQVYRGLLDAICDGALAAGERLAQEDIALRMDVSRQPVLQALRLLKKDGFVQDAPGRGVQVAPLEPARMRKVYEVRGALDALAARLAAQRRFQVPVQLIENGRHAVYTGNVQAMIDADMAFHTAIYMASENELIVQSAERHWMHLRRAMGAVLRSQAHHETLWDEHEGIALAIADGYAVQAAQLSDDHTIRASKALDDKLTQLLAPRAQGDRS